MTQIKTWLLAGIGQAGAGCGHGCGAGGGRGDACGPAARTTATGEHLLPTPVVTRHTLVTMRFRRLSQMFSRGSPALATLVAAHLSEHQGGGELKGGREREGAWIVAGQGCQLVVTSAPLTDHVSLLAFGAHCSSQPRPLAHRLATEPTRRSGSSLAHDLQEAWTRVARPIWTSTPSPPTTPQCPPKRRPRNSFSTDSRRKTARSQPPPGHLRPSSCSRGNRGWMGFHRGCEATRG